ncbi:MAG: V-type ATPase subunit [Clostridia bacterium]|nr:V-type ATPase subunit [Clostridia bacterium]
MSKSANAVLARVRAMYGKRLTATDYANLLSCKNTDEIAAYLKSKTAYGDIFAPNAGTQITAESIEFSLKKEQDNRMQKICTFERMINDKFYEYYILKSDILAIISAARTLVSHTALASAYVPSDFFKNRSSLNFDKLYNIHSADELIEATKHTRYYATAKKFIGADGLFDFSSVEVHLNRLYATTAKEMAKSFPKGARAELATLVDIEIDRLNIENIYRLKKLGMSKEDIFAKLIFEHGTISKSKLLALLDAKSDYDYISIFGKTKLGKGFTSKDFIYPEGVFTANMYAINKRYLRFSSNPDIAVITYMNLLRTEIENITHIVEGKRYGMQTEEIKTFLAGVNMLS